MIYVDAAIWVRAGVKKPRKKYAHMVADTLLELHAFAQIAGVKKHFFHDGVVPHYDINDEQHARIIQCFNVKQVSSKMLVIRGRKMR